MIEATQLSKRFGAVEAVRSVTLRAADGRITGLLGPNGAGKSTTLRILYTVLAPSGGRALVDGLDVVQQPLEARRRIGVLPHGAGIYPQLTARENIVYFGALHGLSRRERRARAQELIELLEMRDFADRRAKGYSQGERVKTALARALVQRPQNVLLDEPTSGLDVMAVRSLRTILRTLRAQGHCVLFSSHVMQEVSALCDQIVIVARGRVVAHGSADELVAASGRSNLEDAFVTLTGEEVA